MNNENNKKVCNTPQQQVRVLQRRVGCTEQQAREAVNAFPNDHEMQVEYLRKIMPKT